MDVNDYADQIVDQFIREITDCLFLFIEQNKDKMQEYTNIVNQNNGDSHSVNIVIGKKIRERLDLENDGENKNPKSKLIEYYTYHKK